jgi:hypothetical protein
MGSGTLLATTSVQPTDDGRGTDRRTVLVFSAVPPGADPEVTRRVERLDAAGFAVRTVAPPAGVRPRSAGWFRRTEATVDLGRLTRLPGWDDAVAYVREPTPDLLEALRRHRPALVVYEAPEEPDARRGTRRDQLERALLGIAGVVIAPDECVADRLRARGAAPTVLPPAAEIGTWREQRGPRRDPTIGVIADLDGQVDVEVVRAIATARPAWRVRVTGAGPDPLTRSLVGSLPNASVEPAAAPHLVADRNAALDAAVLGVGPGVDDRRLCQTVLELLAAGTPVVTNRRPSLIEIRPIVRLATTPEAVVPVLEQELAQEDPRRAAARRRVAESYGPACRLEGVIHAITAALAARPWAERPIVTG